ncbi:MAG: hypothetical protein HY903_23350 [Deltaproteobacteria bacterium]|nr:hypothetical protein [Deltaproteobacteria bacterium]
MVVGSAATAAARESVGRLAFLAILVLGLAASQDGRAQNYIGASQCKTCHEFEYRVWAAGPHARADKSLSERERKDAKCNTCHMMATEEDTAEFSGIECERCHGPGRYYHRRYVMRDRELARLVGLLDPKAEHCQQCHTEGGPSIKPFDYDEMWAKIDHRREARARWEKSRANVPTSQGEVEDEP